jgi:hypothetical protein
MRNTEMLEAVPVGEMARSSDGEVSLLPPTNRTLFEYCVVPKILRYSNIIIIV